jgi:hypothetical protein
MLTEQERSDSESVLSGMMDYFEHRIECKMLIWGLGYAEAADQLMQEIIAESHA